MVCKQIALKNLMRAYVLIMEGAFNILVVIGSLAIAELCNEISAEDKATIEQIIGEMLSIDLEGKETVERRLLVWASTLFDMIEEI